MGESRLTGFLILSWRSALNVLTKPFTSRITLSILALLFESPTRESSKPVGASPLPLAISRLRSKIAGSVSVLTTMRTSPIPTVVRSLCSFFGSHGSDA